MERRAEREARIQGARGVRLVRFRMRRNNAMWLERTRREDAARRRDVRRIEEAQRREVVRLAIRRQNVIQWANHQLVCDLASLWGTRGQGGVLGDAWSAPGYECGLHKKNGDQVDCVSFGNYLCHYNRQHGVWVPTEVTEVIHKVAALLRWCQLLEEAIVQAGGPGIHIQSVRDVHQQCVMWCLEMKEFGDEFMEELGNVTLDMFNMEQRMRWLGWSEGARVGVFSQEVANFHHNWVELVHNGFLATIEAKTWMNIHEGWE
jgi:hypothetical protein